jgi:hypothetical protein
MEKVLSSNRSQGPNEHLEKKLEHQHLLRVT